MENQDNPKAVSDKPAPAVSKSLSKRPKKVTYEAISAFSTLVISLLTLGIVYYSSKQADIVKNQEVLQLRAYVGLTDAEIKNISPDSVPEIIFHIRNFGLTPASNVKIKYSFIYRDKEIFDTEDRFNSYLQTSNGNYQSYPSETILYPNNPVGLSLSLSVFTQDQLATFYVRGAAIGWYGTISYEDIFQEPKFADFCVLFYDLAVAGEDVPSDMCANHRDAN